MIDGNQVHFQDLIYSDPSDIFLVYKGLYTPFNSSGQQEFHNIAIKELKIPTDSQSIVSGTVQEIALQMKLEDCPYVCKCYGYFANENKIFIVSELLGLDLDKDCRLRKGRKYAEPDLIKWMDQVLQALIYAKDRVTHRQRIAHRDMRPHNILFAQDDKMKIIDFGSGVISDGKVEKVAGMPLYMSPEQVPILREFQRNGRLSNCKINAYQSDVYSLGVTFLHLALMEPPVNLLIEDREVAVRGYLAQVQINYPVLYWALYYMLQTDVSKRPDFTQILTYLRQPGDPRVLIERVKPSDDLSYVNQMFSAFWTCVAGWEQQFAIIAQQSWLPYFESLIWRNCDYCQKPFEVRELVDDGLQYLACQACFQQRADARASRFVANKPRGYSPAVVSARNVSPIRKMGNSRSSEKLQLKQAPGVSLDTGRRKEGEFWREVEQGEHEW